METIQRLSSFGENETLQYFLHITMKKMKLH